MTKSLQHFGILGMKWGHHKPRPAEVRTAIGNAAKNAGSSASATAKKAAGDVSAAFKEKHKSRITPHNQEVKDLQKQIKDKKNQRVDEFFSKMNVRETAFNAKMEGLRKAKLADIDASSQLGIIKAVKKMLTNDKFNSMYIDKYGKLEEKMWKEDDAQLAARKKNKTAGEKQILAKFDQTMKTRAQEITNKKQPWVTEMKEMLALDKELSQQLTVDLLRNTLANT
jgi:hypothetical protein